MLWFKKRCQHYPVIELEQFMESQRLSPGKVGWSFWSDRWYCSHCKKPLKALWKVRKK